jgi:hypothetical protein
MRAQKIDPTEKRVALWTLKLTSQYLLLLDFDIQIIPFHSLHFCA